MFEKVKKLTEKVKKLFEYNKDERTIFVRCGTKVNETDPVQISCEWTFQLDSWTEEEIMELAARSLTIDAQRKFRKGELDADCEVSKDDLTSDRKRGPSKKQAHDFLAQMTPEARKAWLEEQGLL